MGARFEQPSDPQRHERLGVVRHVLYLIFSKGHTSSAGPLLHRVDLTNEAIRLTRLLHRLLPGDTETTGLLVDVRGRSATPSPGRRIPCREDHAVRARRRPCGTRMRRPAPRAGTAPAAHRTPPPPVRRWPIRRRRTVASPRGTQPPPRRPCR